MGPAPRFSFDRHDRGHHAIGLAYTPAIKGYPYIAPWEFAVHLVWWTLTIRGQQ